MYIAKKTKQKNSSDLEREQKKKITSDLEREQLQMNKELFPQQVLIGMSEHLVSLLSATANEFLRSKLVPILNWKPKAGIS